MPTIGACEHCCASFSYELVHAGFSDAAYAYCDQCGLTALLSGWKPIPARAGLWLPQAIARSAEPFLAPCICGGRFRSGASPRCPHCVVPLFAEAAGRWIEHNAPGTEKGWRWQRNWSGLYAIVIERRSVCDNWINS